MQRYNLTFIILLGIGCVTGKGQIFQSSDLPIIVLNTNGAYIQDEPKVIVDMGIIDNGQAVRNNITDPFVYSGKIAIEIRGSSSQMFPKKQYGFKLLNAASVEVDTSLLNLPAEKSWILFAPYNDKSLMRDVLAYKLGRDQGRYAPRTRYCELVINGQYEGIYVLIEKITRDKNRVDIAKLDPADLSGNDLTGGYIIKIDKFTGDYDPGWLSDFPPLRRGGNQNVNFLYEYPDADVILPEQKDYIRNFINAFETVLKSPDFKDPLDGYAKYIDVNSFVDFFIMNEVSKNVDGYRLSTYMHKQKNSDGGKLVMGPIWDFNLGFGNANYCTSGTTEGLVLEFNNICPDDYWLIPFWWDRLFQDPAFLKKVDQRWNELRADKFSTNNILAYIDSVSNALTESRARNFQRWPVIGQELWPNYFIGNTYMEELDWLKNWVSQRMVWLDGYVGGLITATERPDLPSGLLISAYPNPSGEYFSFHLQFAQPGNAGIEIYDLLGQKVESRNTGHKTHGSFVIQAGNTLTKGQYYYRITFNGHPADAGKLFKN